MGNWFGLYYPHVHFRDDAWLKTVALTWDGIYHLTGEDVESSMPYISRVQIELTGEGVINSFTPTAANIRAAAGEFLDALTGIDTAAHQVPESLYAHYGFRQTLAEWKVDPDLVEIMASERLALPEGSGRLRMSDTLIHAYLLILGRKNAVDLGAVPIADTAGDQSAAALDAARLVRGLMGAEPAPVQPSEQSALLVNLAVTNVLPRDVEDIPVDRIVAFRWKYADERSRFREAVVEVAKDVAGLTGITDRAVLLHHLQAAYDRKISPAVRDLERAMRGQRMEVVHGVMGVQVAAPTAVAGSVALLATQPSPLIAAAIGAGGFALGVVKSAQQAAKQRQEKITTSPMSFLYHARHDLDSEGLVARAMRAARRFAPSSS